MSIVPLGPERPDPRRVVVFDLEWYPGTYELRLAGLYDGRKYRWFETAEALLQALCVKQYAGAHIYSHFGGAADEQFLLAPWLRSRFKVEGTFSGGSMVYAKVTRGKNRWHFLDSYWTLRRPLADIARSVGLEKGVLGGEYRCAGGCAHPAEHACVFYAPLEILISYNENDCLILHAAMTRFQEEIRELGGELRATAASTALQLFRRAYLDEKIRTHEWLNQWSRGAYVASRVEVFRPRLRGRGAFWDVNSMFPWAMRHDTPGNVTRTTARWSGEELAIVDATVNVPDTYLPPLGFRDRDGVVYHPTGRWRQKFTGVDLRALEATGGRVDAVHRTILFEPRQELAAYVTELYERRKRETDPFRRDLYKLLMNSLYGKFGEQTTKKQMTIERGRITMRHVDKYIPHRHVPIGATITARSRQLLGRYLRAADEAGGVYYADTDSVVTKATLAEGVELGELKREKEIQRLAVFFRPKFYKVDGENVKAKGFSRLSGEAFDRLLAGEPVEITRMRRIREKVAEMMRDGTIDSEGMVGWLDPLHPCDGTFSKKLNMDLRPKRAPDGRNQTRPWTVAELR